MLTESKIFINKIISLFCTLSGHPLSNFSDNQAFKQEPLL